MRILYLTNYPSPYRVDFHRLLGKSASITVLYAQNPEEQDERNKEWFDAKYENFTPVFLKKKIGIGKHEICFDVLKHLKKDYDLIVMGGYSMPTQMLAIEYMKAKGIPFCMEIDGGLIRPDNPVKGWIKRRYLSSAAAWLSSGKAANRYLTHYGADEKRIYEYPFTSMWKRDLSEHGKSPAEKNELRRKLQMHEKKIVLTVGSFIHRKGFDILMRAAVQFGVDIGVYIVGGEPTEEYLRMQNELQLTNVHFVGFKKKDALAEYFDAADVFVMPTRSDVWGLVVSEAMAHGLPVVSSDQCVAGLELIRDGENGYIVPVEDEKALAEATLRVLNGDSLAMGRKALERVQDYTIENMVQRHIEIFEDILNNR